MNKVVIWNNGETHSDECIRFYDYAPLTQKEVVELIDCLKRCTWLSEQRIIGFGELSILTGEKGYPVQPLATIYDQLDYAVNDEAPVEALARANELLKKLGVKEELRAY